MLLRSSKEVSAEAPEVGLSSPQRGNREDEDERHGRESKAAERRMERPRAGRDEEEGSIEPTGCRRTYSRWVLAGGSVKQL